jgi:hypothetical protein
MRVQQEGALYNDPALTTQHLLVPFS